MKFRVYMKTPDALDRAIADAVHLVPVPEGRRHEEGRFLDEMYGHAELLCKAWWKDGELLTVEVDTSEGTCVVVERK
jgi:hypothetical protein